MSKRFPNSLCQSNGHDWMKTMADNYRVCQREKCPVAERLVNGTWVPVTPQQRARVARFLQGAQPQTLWDEHTLLAQGLHPRQREIERATEQRYYQFSR